MTRTPSHRSGFTFIEVIITVIIIAILLSMVFVAVDPIRRIHQGRNARRAEDIRAVADAIALKTTDTQRRIKFSSVVNHQWRMLGTATLPALNNDVTRDTVLGDANRNLSIDAADYAVWAANFNLSTQGLDPQEAYRRGDYNLDGSVGAADYTLWANNFGEKNPGDYHDCLTSCGSLGGSEFAVRLGYGASALVKDAFADIGNGRQPTLDFKNATIAFWLRINGKISTQSVTVPIFQKGKLTVSYLPHARQIQIEVTDDSTSPPSLLIPADALSDGSYHHLALVFGESNTSVIMDDTVLFYGGPLPLRDNAEALIFGNSPNISPSIDIDDVRFYKAELASSDVQIVSQGGQLNAGFPLWAYWMLDEGSGTESENSADILPERKMALSSDAQWIRDVPSMQYQTMATCSDLETDLKDYLPRIPIAPPGAEDIPPSEQATYYAIRIAHGGVQLQACNSEGVDVGGTGIPPVIESAR